MGRGETVALLGIQVSFLTLDGLRHLLLPAVNLALFKMSLVTRLARAGTREVVHQDYIKFARAKGLSPRRVVLVHVLKNIMIPVVTVIGLEFGGLIAFSVVTESVFAWPGMGKLIIESIQNLDRPVIVAYLMITVLMFVFINVVVDVLYSVLDPGPLWVIHDRIDPVPARPDLREKQTEYGKQPTSSRECRLPGVERKSIRDAVTAACSHKQKCGPVDATVDSAIIHG